MSESKIYDHLELLGPRVLARPLSDLEVTKGGIVRPDSSRQAQNRAVVEKVGPGERRDSGEVVPLPFEIGDVIFYQKFAGAWIVLDERERLMLMADEIQARLPVADVQLVRHGDDETTDHLEGEGCLICSQQRDSDAKASLHQMREELRDASSSGS